MLTAFLAIILTMILVIGLHEAGHALAARLLKVNIKRISIGFGRPLIQWKLASGVEWVWALWPFGGYVQLANTRISPEDPKDLAYCFDKKPIWARVVVLLAGGAANLITAWLAFTLVFYLGLNYKIPQIQSVQANSMAAQAGFMPGDQFVSIGGNTTSSWQAVGEELIIHWGSQAVSVVMRQADATLKTVSLDLKTPSFRGQARSLLSVLGISPDLSLVELVNQSPSFLAAMGASITAMSHLLYFFMIILKQLITGVVPFSLLLGPLGLFAVSVASFTQGLAVYFYFIASLSSAVAVINLFPIPGLDGGSILYALIEKIRGKPISIALELLIYRLVMIALSLLFVQLMLNDLSRVLIHH